MQKKNLTASDFVDTKITSVVIDECVETIEPSCFGDCHQLKTVYFNAINCKSVGKKTQNAFGKFGAIHMYGEIYYKKYTAVDSFVIGDKVKRLPNNLFTGTDITSITIPASVEEIEDGAFVDVPLLKDIIVDPNNTTFMVDNGILYNKKTGRMICAPRKIKMAKIYYLPDFVKEVGEYAFDNRLENPMEIHFPADVEVPKNNKLKKRKIIVDGVSEIIKDDNLEIIDGKLINVKNIGDNFEIPKTVKIIGKNAFRGYMRKLVIPATVEKIEGEAFSRCGVDHLIIEGQTTSCEKTMLKDSEVRLITFYNKTKKKVSVYLPIFVSVPRRQRAISSLGIDPKKGFDFDISKYLTTAPVPKEEGFMFEYFANRYFSKNISVTRCMKPGIEDAIKNDLITVEDFQFMYEKENLTKTNIKYLIEYAEQYTKEDIAEYLKNLRF